jgi:hypothetical protein
MKIYTTNGPVQISTGHVRLDENQARRRSNHVKHIEGDLYEVVRPFQFKRGERFGYDGVIPKVLADVVLEEPAVEVDEAKPTAKAKPRK